MDSLSHVLLGAAIGEGTLGKQAGKKVMLWGALAGTAPDIDVIAGLFLSDVSNIIFHRGITHSFFFILLTSPLYGWLISKFSRAPVNWKQWTFMVFLSQLAHILLDSLTTYGTQLLLPFSNKAVALNTIAIIDPIYTIPLFFTVLLLLILPVTYHRRATITALGIFLSTGYLFITMINKYTVENHFLQQLDKQGFEVHQIDVKPTMFNNLLWRGIAYTGDGHYAMGHYSFVDERYDVDFEIICGNHELLADYQDYVSVKRLKWVSNGFYQVRQTDEGYIFNDLRFGRLAEFSDEDSPYIFSYALKPTDDGNEFDVSKMRLRIDREREGNSIRDLGNRIFGIED